MTTTNDITIREAAPDDAAVIADIIRAAFAEQARLDPPSGALQETEERVRERLTTGHLALAELEGEASGCVYYEARGDHVYFGRLAVLPSYRGRGVGASLIAYVERHAAERGIGRIQIGVRLALPRMRARYERLGYRPVEERAHAGYSAPTWLVMEKVLE